MANLKEIETFITVSRHLNFNAAANELNVSASTVSRRIKNLEMTMGQALFTRNSNQIQLTRNGKDFLDVANSALQVLETGIEKIRNNTQQILHVKTLRAFAKHYIGPNQFDFEARYSPLQLKVDTHEFAAELDGDSFDVALLVGGEDWNGLESELVKPCICTFLCAPELADGRELPTRIEQLPDYPLLGYESSPELWPEAFNWFGLKDINKYNIRFFDNEDLFNQAAIQGQGLSISASPFMDEMLISKQLIRPVDAEFSFGHSIYLVYGNNRRSNPAVQAFRSWIKQQVKDAEAHSTKLFNQSLYKVSAA